MTYRCAARGDDLEFYVYGPVGEMFDGISAEQFIRDLNAARSARRIALYINSPGGSAFDGLAMYTALGRHQAEKTVHIDGYAASAASIIAMAGDRIRIAAGGFVMIHEAAGITLGDAEAHRQTASTLESISESIAAVYASRTGISAEKTRDLMRFETWFTASDAVAAKFADEIVPNKQAAACAIPQGLRAVLRHVPAAQSAAPVLPRAGSGPVPDAYDVEIARMQATVAQHRARQLAARAVSPKRT